MQNDIKKAYFARAWNGEIKLWQSVCLSVLGLIFAFVLASLLGLVVLFLKTSGYINFNIMPLNNFIMVLSLVAVNVFTIRSVWLCASSPKVKMQHAIARFWAILLSVYVVAIYYSLGTT